MGHADLEISVDGGEFGKGHALTAVAKTGAPEEIRTPDPQIRSLVLYPAELRARFSL
jgi:hypothetical protein